MSSAKDATPALSAELLKRAPKVLLHEHLDGGLRPDALLFARGLELLRGHRDEFGTLRGPSERN